MRVRQVFLALVLAIGLALLAKLLLSKDSSAVQAHQNPSRVSIEAPKTLPTRDVAPQGNDPIWAIETVEDLRKFVGLTNRSLALDRDGHPHLAYGGEHLYYAWHDGIMWYYQTIDPSPNVGTYTSIRLDSNDRPHISYYDAANEDLKYAHRIGDVWDIQTIDRDGSVGIYTSLALDIDDHPHISYRDSHNGHNDGNLKYAYWTGIAWISETVDSSGECVGGTSLAVDTDGHPHISYYKIRAAGPYEPPYNIQYAHWTGSAWDIQVVGPAGGASPDTSLVLDWYGRPHISYCYSVSAPAPRPTPELMYARWTGDVWDVQTVDSFFGGANSLVLDSNGRPHISYSGYLSMGVEYARWTGDAWDIQKILDDYADHSSLAIAADGYPRIGYCRSGNSLEYAHWTGSEWNVQVVDRSGYVGKSTSLALDSKVYPHISYYNANSTLKYAYWTGSAWISETVDSNGNVEGGTSLALDTDDYPHISYCGSGNSLKYARWTGTAWESETVDGASCGYPSLSLDSSGYPHIGYAADGLKYAYWTGSIWVSETVDSVSVGYPSLSLDSNGYPHISYYDGYPNRDLKYAYWTGVAWVSETVDSSGDVGQYTSLALDADGYPRISYYDDYPNHDLKYAYWTGVAWVSETVDSSGDVGQYTSLALDLEGYPHISYYDGYHTRDLKYAHWTGVAWVSETVDSSGDVGQYTSLALDADGYPHVSYYDASQADLKYARLILSLHLNKQASPLDGLQNDGVLTYTLTLSSSGLNVCLWDPLPENVLYISDSLTSTLTPPATYSTAVRAVVWEGTLAAGATYEVSFQVTPAITGAEALSLPIVNTAWVTGTHSSVSTSATVIVNAYRLYFPIIGKHH